MMGTIYHSTRLSVPAEVAWDFLDRYTRSEVHVFSVCVSEHQDGDYRVVTLPDGTDVYERNITIDPDRMRAVYTVPGIGAEHHQAEMSVRSDGNGGATLVWITDVLPNSLVPELQPTYEVLFGELVAAVNAHKVSTP